MMKFFTLFCFLCFHISLMAAPIPEPELCIAYVDREQIIKDKAFDEVTNYQNLLQTIADKTVGMVSRNAAIEAAKEFFMPSAIIEVSSVNHTRITKYPFHEYLIHLRDLNYQLVKIDFERQKIKIKTKINDNHYILVANCIQHFEGIDENGDTIYQDITLKDIEIDVKFKKDRTFEIVTKIKFKNITVRETLKKTVSNKNRSKNTSKIVDAKK